MKESPFNIRRLDRRAFLRLSAGSALGLAAAGCTSATPAPPPATVPATVPAALPPPAPPPPPAATAEAVAAHPNVLLVTIDTWRTDHTSSYGGATRTRYADQLAAEGVRFANAYVQLPQTTPSHAALFTGQYPSTSGVRISQHQQLALGTPTLAAALAAQGYRTGGLYSWYSLDGPLMNLDQGFELYENLNVRPGTTDVLPPGFVAEARQRGETPELIADARADVTTNAAIAWLEDAARDRARPFFLWVHYRDPHYPYEAPPPYDELYMPKCAGCADGSFDTLGRIWGGWKPSPDDLARIHAAYAGEVTFTDAELGRLLTRLDALGLGERTLVVLTADHGESFGEHDEWFHGYKLYQPTVHVPLVMRLPGTIPAGQTVASAAQAIDIMPTVLALTGLPAASTVDGRSLTPAILGESMDDHVAIAEIADQRYHALVAGEWKLMRDNQTNRRALYRLSDDPREQNDRAAANRSTLLDLDAILDQWLATRAAGTLWQR